VVEADPGRGHGIGVDVVQQVVDRQILHREIQLTGELSPDELRILGQKEDPLSRGQGYGIGRFHRL
jgi:hypothetical protein